MTISRAEVITSFERRRRWSQDEKERLVAASLEPGANVSEVARVAGLHVSQLFRWRKELCRHGEASIAPFVPVEIGVVRATAGGGRSAVDDDDASTQEPRHHRD
ncbi:transposase-like protein [Bradyrhizobium sp. USDA 4524]|uniref:transposase n=1 Tax=unclassified Bradyrhizobium TaxID=2631580 RepID=UPI00209CD524|nr:MULTISPECIES: transposase [unclassified Bradyrhizobium]MCP1838576.1 transposase [Bradyrhizobium sp. USDA 4538]MCP1899141.1 transposase [Bradyrhizobium sp. USDA 4537]MCP1986746.1 transposase [Bradyrhizobium sp. USDA 4539]